MKVATHPGNFHADDVFAIAVIGLVADGPLEILRTRDEALHAAADVRVDVGGRSDPATGDFDHHQKGGAGERPNGIRYASFGLAWRAYGERLAGSADAAAAIDERLVQGVDANDTGQTITESLVAGVRPMTVSGVIAAMNPAWDESLTSAEEDARFGAAVALATRILEGELAGSAAFRRAHDLVHAAIGRADDPRIIELDRNMPWREAVVTTAPDALFVVYPKTDGWGMQAVPKALGAFDNRKDLPAQWAGLTGDELAAVTGVEGAIFCHTARFYASAQTREGITALATLAIDARD
ncbi:MAG TPA: MYG1 family protein [Baekduia sp.]|uniref:MYG1 family protein n=1 Tax=Baekduia sp. TaxID=2600305 RepID=UPI002C1F70AF|nr:MYG1 family protein [Baekduia sp.]HMJ33634.1 MYG1 family protein [Baekduia sp.]